ERGLTFTNGFTNSCTCSPSRTTLFTGLYPAQHGAIEVLEFDNSGRPELLPDGTTTGTAPESAAQGGSGSGNPAASVTVQGATLAVKERRQRGLTAQLQNLAKILKTAGYHVVYKGKWHL